MHSGLRENVQKSPFPRSNSRNFKKSMKIALWFQNISPVASRNLMPELSGTFSPSFFRATFFLPLLWESRRRRIDCTEWVLAKAEYDRSRSENVSRNKKRGESGAAMTRGFFWPLNLDVVSWAWRVGSVPRGGRRNR